MIAGNRPRARTVVGAITLVVLAGFVFVVSADAPARPTSNAFVFTDRAGDNSPCCTRDITSVSVANNDGGTITFKITSRGETEDDDDLVILIDADRDRTTGDEHGAEYRIFADIETSLVEEASLSRWSAARAQFEELARRDVQASAAANIFRFVLDRHVLGDTDGFRFAVQLWEVTTLGGMSTDWAPDQGMWAFPIKIATRRLTPTLSTLGGRRSLVARLGLRVSGTRQLLASGRIACTATVAGRRLEIVRRGFVTRRAICVWRLPRRPVGKTVTGRVGVFVTADSRSFVGRAFRVRIGSLRA